MEKDAKTRALVADLDAEALGTNVGASDADKPVNAA
jgi:hypothetical protein